MRFKPGQQVVCINGVEWENKAPERGNSNCPMPKSGEIVTVERYADVSDYIVLVEYPYYSNFGGRICFEECCFEPLMDIRELEEILEQEPELA